MIFLNAFVSFAHTDQRATLKDLARLNVSENNPVLREFGRIVKDEYEKNPDSLSIVFTKTRESAKALMNWLNEDRVLKELKLNAGFMIGSGEQGLL